MQEVSGSIPLGSTNHNSLFLQCCFSHPKPRTVGAFLAHELVREAEVVVQTAQECASLRGLSLAVLKKLALRV